jgi:excisionase family DNA binding protein
MRGRICQSAGKTSEAIERRAWTVRELCRAYGMSRGFWDKEIRQGRLTGHRFGSAIRVLDADLKTYLATVKTVA